MNVPVYQLNSDFVVTGPDLSATPVAVTPSLYSDLDKNFNGFQSHYLLSFYEFTHNWDSWERHPAGDEVVVLLKGAIEFCLEVDKREQWVTLREPNSYVIVPKNIWHTANIHNSAQVLFITPGEGTENRDR